jgi:hypothetical protein
MSASDEVGIIRRQNDEKAKLKHNEKASLFVVLEFCPLIN